MSFHLLLEEDGNAGTFSEEYYQQVYRRELRKWLELQEEVQSLLRKPFDSEAAAADFHERHIRQINFYKGVLPEWILRQIADIRVFAFHKATRSVIDAMTRYCTANEQAVKAVGENYRKYLEGAKTAIGEEMIRNFSFHDCKIVQYMMNGGTLRLLLDTSGGFTEINEIELRDVQILRQDGTLENSVWLYEEIYKENDRYEFHVLLQHPAEGLIDFILTAREVAFYCSP